LNTKNTPKRFIECAAEPTGTIYFDYFDEGIRIVIMRGPASVNTYLGIPLGHPLAGYGYDDVPVECHGGLTYSGNKIKNLPEGYWWYGYDYCHCDDMAFHDLTYRPDSEDKPWTPEEIKADVWSATYSLRRLMKLAESIYLKAKVGK
jgi:hypothetical protein